MENEKIKKQAEQLRKHLNYSPALQSKIMYKSFAPRVSMEEILKAIFEAATKDVARGVSTHGG